MRAIVVPFVAAAIASGLPACVSAGDEEGDLGVKVIKQWHGVNSGVTKPARTVVKDRKAWSKLWRRVHARRRPLPEPPQIDFETQMVLAVFLGIKRTGGYDVRIVRVVESGRRLEVFVKSSSPAPGDIVTQALTAPYHIVVVPKSEKRVVFRDVEKDD